MSQAATICKSNFKVSFEAGQTASRKCGTWGGPSGKNGRLASILGYGDGSGRGLELPWPCSFPKRPRGHRDSSRCRLCRHDQQFSWGSDQCS